MKKYLITLLLAVLTLCSMSVSAKKEPVQRIYMFGLAASFTDTIVHITSMQVVDSVGIDTKNGFLLDRQVYSYQLRDYLEREGMPHRTCVVFYSPKKEKLQKKLDKMVKLYSPTKADAQHFDLRIIGPQQFHFTAVNYAVTVEPDDGQ